MIDLKDVEDIHDILTERFGGSKGIHDSAALESAINRLFQNFDQKELYPTTVDKATAIFESIISNHPFMDGNKRIAYVLMRITLLEGKLDIVAHENAKYDFVIAATKGKLQFDKIRDWISRNSFSTNT
jgi:death-on-curing protein